MPLLLIFIGAILIVSALKNTQAELAIALEQDIPGYLIWAAAIFAIVALGWIPPLRTPSRWLLALVLVVIVLTRYQQIIQGFQAITQGGGAAQPAAAVPTQAAAYTQAVSNTQASSPIQQAASATGAVGSAISGFGSVASDLPVVGDLLGGIFG